MRKVVCTITRKCKNNKALKQLALVGMALVILLMPTGCSTSAPSNNSSNISQPAISSNLQQEDVFSSSHLENEDNNSDSFLFKTEYSPVAVSQNRFIVRNTSGNLYGVVDSSGSSILPCEYESIKFFNTKNQTILEVQRKGSYGAFDLDGNELIPCEYTSISTSPFHDSCIVQNFMWKKGVVDFSGNAILPIEFDILKFGDGKIFAAGKRTDTDQDVLTVAAYNSNGDLIKDFAWEKDNINDILVGNGGNVLCVSYYVSGRGNDMEFLPIEGTTDFCQGRTEGNHLFYFQGSELMARDISTLEEKSIWSFPNSQDWNFYEIRNSHSYIDPVTDTEFVDLFVVGTLLWENEGMSHNLRISFGDRISVIDYVETGIETSTIGENNLGEFYNDVAIVFPTQGYLYTINPQGEKIDEITKPYTSRSESLLLGNAAVLNNNGFYSIIDSNGEILLSEDGYSDVQKTSANGIYAVTDQNGQMGLISHYAEELVPCGEITSIETAIGRPKNDSWEIESTRKAEDELCAIYYENKWAVYKSAYNDRDDSCYQLLTDFTELTEENSWQNDCFLGNSGYALMDEEGDTVYLISFDGISYEVFPFINLSETDNKINP